jgi:alkanesulfonate monooxygenase SsuD/methylene tetrahydromethanopterin reductase-like flavin-dependent oxidoreductase (luciferase family)
MEKWVPEEGCGGFNITLPILPDGLDDFVERVVPELQPLGIFRRQYKGRIRRVF